MHESLSLGTKFPRLEIYPSEDYALRPFWEAFDVQQILHMAGEKGNLPSDHVFYLVDFGSQLKPGADEDRLNELDDDAHQEAALSDGFLLYFRGDPDEQGHCRSFCVWRSIKEGVKTSKKPAHMAAAAVVDEMYEWYQVTMREARSDASPPGFSFGLVRTYSSDGKLHIAVQASS